MPGNELLTLEHRVRTWYPSIFIVDRISFWMLTVGLNLNDKKAVVAEVSAEVAEAQTIVLAEYRGTRLVT